MKKMIVAFGILSLVAMPALADFSGGTMNATKQVGYYGGDFAGEFTLFPHGADPYLSNAFYDVKAKNLGFANSFQTFCMEMQEHADSPIDIVVSMTDINEGTGAIVGPGSHAVLGGMPFGDNLDIKTAWLYTEFARGTLVGFDYGATRAASAQALQYAIWKIEGESNKADTNALAQAFLTAANAAVAGGWNSIGLVRVLNTTLHGYPGERRQDFLYLLPAPGAAILALVGLGIAGGIRRRRAAAN